MIVEVAFLPSTLRDVERKVAIVVDALRASSTILALFDAGADEVLVAADPSEAFAIAAGRRERFVICGERGGLPPPGFDFGNSPSQLSALDLAGRQAILTTSNGTRALRAVTAARLALVGTGRNGAAVASHALSAAESTACDITIICAGDDEGVTFSLEDFFFAGFLVELIASRREFNWPVDESDPCSGDPTCWVLDESAVAARRCFRSYLTESGDQPLQPSTASLIGMFRDARNGRSLPRIGYAADLEYCAGVNCSSAIPRLTRRDGRLLLVGEAGR